MKKLKKKQFIRIAVLILFTICFIGYRYNKYINSYDYVYRYIYDAWKNSTYGYMIKDIEIYTIGSTNIWVTYDNENLDEDKLFILMYDFKNIVDEYFYKDMESPLHINFARLDISFARIEKVKGNVKYMNREFNWETGEYTWFHDSFFTNRLKKLNDF